MSMDPITEAANSVIALKSLGDSLVAAADAPNDMEALLIIWRQLQTSPEIFQELRPWFMVKIDAKPGVFEEDVWLDRTDG